MFCDRLACKEPIFFSATGWNHKNHTLGSFVAKERWQPTLKQNVERAQVDGSWDIMEE